MCFVMNKLMLLGGFLLACLNMGCIRDGEPSSPAGKLDVGEQIPEFSVVLNEGTVLNDADLKGKVSVLVFFVHPVPIAVKSCPISNACMMLFKAMHVFAFIVSAGKILRKTSAGIGRQRDLPFHT